MIIIIEKYSVPITVTTINLNGKILRNTSDVICLKFPL